MPTKSGETIPVLTNSEAIRDEAGNIIRSNSIYRDITNLKQKQAEILAANRSLEGQVQERTRQLMKRNKELEQFAFVASHDLQEALLTITNFSKRLLNQYQGQFDEPGQRALNLLLRPLSACKNWLMRYWAMA